ncbi:MAG: GDSL-type esterase/lipase family protein [Acidobacteriota bacterium]
MSTTVSAQQSPTLTNEDFGVGRPGGLNRIIMGRSSEGNTRPRRVNSGALEDPSGRGLTSFYEALRQIETGERLTPIHILHYGDSHTAADLLTGTLRRLLQERFGDGGAGFLFAGRPWKTYWHTRARFGNSSGWLSEGIGTQQQQNGFYGLGGVSMVSRNAGETIWVETIWSNFDIYLWKEPAGGQLSVYVDGILNTTTSLQANEPQVDYLTLTAVEGLHRVELRTLDNGCARIFGFIAERANGLSYDTLGINGARVTRLLSWNEKLLTEHLARRRPDLIIVAYGTNEMSDLDWHPITYAAQFSAAVNRLQRAVPSAAILILGPPERAIRQGRKWQVLDNQLSIIEVQRRVAQAHSWAFWNSYRAMGGKGSIHRWSLTSPPLAQPDHVHLTRAGYDRIAQLIYQDLIRGYRAPQQSQKDRNDNSAMWLVTLAALGLATGYQLHTHSAKTLLARFSLRLVKGRPRFAAPLSDVPGRIRSVPAPPVD